MHTCDWRRQPLSAWSLWAQSTQCQVPTGWSPGSSQPGCQLIMHFRKQLQWGAHLNGHALPTLNLSESFSRLWISISLCEVQWWRRWLHIRINWISLCKCSGQDSSPTTVNWVLKVGLVSHRCSGVKNPYGVISVSTLLCNWFSLVNLCPSCYSCYTFCVITCHCC